MTAATILMTVFAPEDLAGRGRTKAFGVRGSLIMANCLTRESVRSDQKLYLLGTGKLVRWPGDDLVAQSIYRERFKRELLCLTTTCPYDCCFDLPGARLARPPSIEYVAPVIHEGAVRGEEEDQLGNFPAPDQPCRVDELSSSGPGMHHNCSSVMPPRFMNFCYYHPGLTAFTRTPWAAIRSAAQRVS